MNTINILNLQEKVAIITGASTGLGAATAKMLSASGARVLINHLPGQEAGASAVAAECTGDSLCFAADITQDAECRKIAQAAIDQWGQVDILINNAGINKPVDHDNLEGSSAEDFLKIYNVNVVGAYQMIRAVAPSMQSHGKGVVVNVSSGSGEHGYGSSVPYAASKGAINTLTKSLGRALAPHIRVNAVCPGMVDTPIFDKMNLSVEQCEAMWQSCLAETPLQLFPSPELIARSILFLASDLSAHLTGQLINSDGGASLGVYHQMIDSDNGDKSLPPNNDHLKELLKMQRGES